LAKGVRTPAASQTGWEDDDAMEASLRKRTIMALATRED
jgi:hypothetical protein